MASELPPFDPAKTAQFMMRHGHSAKLGMRFREHGSNWAELELPWRKDLIGEFDSEILASGPIISMLDMASGLAIWTAHGTFAPIATLDLRVDYQRPAKEQSAVIGRCECYKITKSAAFVRGIAHDGDPDDTVATMAAVFMSIAMDTRIVR